MLPPSLPWNDIYPELVNKLRWAICTSAKTPASNYPYSEAQRVATVLAQDIVGLLRAAEEEPGALGSIGAIRSSLNQGRIDNLTTAR